MPEKWGIVVWEIDVVRDLTCPIPIHARIVPVHKNHVDAWAIPILENHVNAGTVHTLKNHVDAGTVHTPENYVDAGTIPILGSRVDPRTFHDHADMPIGVSIP